MAQTSLLNALKEETNFTYTENGAITHKTTGSEVYDMFALGGAYRNRPDEDVILLFKSAYEEDPLYALKCLFYLRDIREGQGERRFFRVCLKWAADKYPESIKKNLLLIPEFGRWDDLFCLFDTKLEHDMVVVIKNQLKLDMESKTPSLLAKWMPSNNTSSAETKKLAKRFMKWYGLKDPVYRKMLSKLRGTINVLEKLMSAGKWDSIDFDKIPSKAGMIYKNAFAKHDIERIKEGKQSYEEFITDENTTVNAKALYPYEVVANAIKKFNYYNINMTKIERSAINKYWDNLTDYFNGANFNGLAVVDTSGSMCGPNAAAPINVAISLGMYCAERAGGPFAGHYISFSSKPQLIKVEGIDFVDKVHRIYKTNLCDNTDIEATFDLILNTAIKNKMSQDQIPENIIVISDMEFDQARRTDWHKPFVETSTLMENIRDKWEDAGYKMPKLVFWNVEARQDNIPMKDEYGVTFVSGCSPVIFDMVMKGKTAKDLMYEKLDSKRYSEVLV